jgi:hypothetical protein
MSKSIAEKFLLSDSGKEYLNTKDNLYGHLGTYLSKHDDSYDIPDPAPIAEEVLKITSN